MDNRKRIGMNQDDLTYKNIDRIVLEAAEKLPVTYNPKAWEKLSGELNSVQILKANSIKTIRFIFLSGFLLILGLSILSFVFLIQNDSINVTRTKLSVSPLKKEALFILNETKNEREERLYKGSFEQPHKDKVLKKQVVFQLKEELKDESIRSETLDRDTSSYKLKKEEISKDTTAPKKPFIFW